MRSPSAPGSHVEPTPETIHTGELHSAKSQKTDAICRADRLCGLWWLAGLYLYLSPDLPEESALRNITLRTPMRVLSLDGALIGQFGEQKRKPLRFDEIPQSFINALLAAEDDGFFEHSGIEPLSLMRAVSELLLTGKKGSGGSTLTMQVARNYFLTLDQNVPQKIHRDFAGISDRSPA